MNATVRTAADGPVTVVHINSLSYTGTTWLNAVLGAHPRAFAIGPADRVYGMAANAAERSASCLVHGAQCDFWPRFWREFTPDRNFFLQVAEQSGCDTLVTNNLLAKGAGAALKHPDIWVKEIQFVRDGRAIAASHRRHTDGRVSFLDSVVEFLAPSFTAFAWDPLSAERLCLRYEDMLAEPSVTLARIGAFIGVDYDDSALRFWQSEQHMTSGNQGTIALIRYGQSLPVGQFRSADFYAAQFERLRTRGPAAFADERWHEELTARERLLFDLVLGDVNNRFGYPRDRFALDEIVELMTELHDLRECGELPAALDGVLGAALGRFAELPRGAARAPAAQPRYGADDCNRPVREQLSLDNLRRNGLHLNPEQVRALARLGGGAMAGLLLLALACVML